MTFDTQQTYHRRFNS